MGKDYSREAAANLRTTTVDLDTWFSGADYTTVSTDDENRVAQEIDTGQYGTFLFKDTNDSQEQFSVSWNGRSSLAPSSSTVYLQIYNRTSNLWEDLDSDNATGADTDFTLEGSKSADLGNYFNASFEIACRVYQQVT